jgi:hypothetical protein
VSQIQIIDFRNTLHQKHDTEYNNVFIYLHVLFSTSSRLALGSTQPPIQWVPGVLSPGVNRPGREVDHSPPTNAEVKKMWIYTSTPSYAEWDGMDWDDLAQDRDQWRALMNTVMNLWVP